MIQLRLFVITLEANARQNQPENRECFLEVSSYIGFVEAHIDIFLLDKPSEEKLL